MGFSNTGFSETGKADLPDEPNPAFQTMDFPTLLAAHIQTEIKEKEVNYKIININQINPWMD